MNLATMKQILSVKDYTARLAAIMAEHTPEVLGVCRYDGKPYGTLMRFRHGGVRVVATLGDFNARVRKAAKSLPKACDGVGIPLVLDSCPSNYKHAGLPC